MSMRGLSHTLLPVSAALLVASASILSAQDRRLFEWTGDVDREVQITMQGRRIWTRDIGNNEPRRHREQVASALPRQEGNVFVELEDGRGSADVVQQPSARNNYTTIVRIRDARGGADRYRLSAYWDDYSNGTWGRGNGNGRGNGRNNRGVNGSGNRDDRGVYDDGGYDDARNRGVYGGTRGMDSRDRTTNGSRTVLHWSGNVDDVLEIRLQGQRVDYRTVSGAGPRNIQADVRSDTRGDTRNGAQDVPLRVTQTQGRGSVYVVEQPSARNGYVTVIRVTDPQGGYGFYDFDLTW